MTALHVKFHEILMSNFGDEALTRKTALDYTMKPPNRLRAQITNSKGCFSKFSCIEIIFQISNSIINIDRDERVGQLKAPIE